ncbi:MAG: CHAP domain-containing protein [Eubacterium sp.]
MKEFMKSLGITRETVKRAARTFIQAIIAYLAVNLVVIDFTAEKQVIKSALIGLAVSALSAGIAAVMNLEKPTECGAGDGILFDDWVKVYLGKGIDYDGVYGVQCVDLIKHYVKNVLGVAPQSIGNAIEYYNKRKTSSYLKNNFTWIDNTASFVPAKGDIAVFTSKSGNGHVSVCTGKGTTSYFYSYDQNYPSGKHEPMTKIKHTYNSFLGVLRPKAQENIMNSAKSNKPNLKVGGTYTMQSVRKCYKDASSKNPYKVSELSAFNCDAVATRKKGTQVKATALSGNWLCYELNGHKVWSCYYDKSTNTAQIK